MFFIIIIVFSVFPSRSESRARRRRLLPAPNLINDGNFLLLCLQMFPYHPPPRRLEQHENMFALLAACRDLATPSSFRRWLPSLRSVFLNRIEKIRQPESNSPLTRACHAATQLGMNQSLSSEHSRAPEFQNLPAAYPQFGIFSH
jgi:hypothetical protein